MRWQIVCSDGWRGIKHAGRANAKASLECQRASEPEYKWSLKRLITKRERIIREMEQEIRETEPDIRNGRASQRTEGWDDATRHWLERLR